MSRGYRRRRYLVGRLQYKLLAFTMVYVAVTVLSIASVVIAPMLLTGSASEPGDPTVVERARGAIYLHENVWPVLLPVLLLIAVHSVLISHRIAGPLVRLRAVMRAAGAGDLAVRAHLRPRDYLWDEARVLNEMLAGLGSGIRRVEERVERLESALARLSLDPQSAVARRQVERELTDLRDALDRFRTHDEPLAQEQAQPPEPAPPLPAAQDERARAQDDRHAGFTLVELMIVVMILAVLASLGVVGYRSSIQTAKEVVAAVEIRDIQDAVDLYLLRNGALPLTLADLEMGPQIDPWRNPYQYLNFSTLPSAGSGGTAKGGKAGAGGGGGGGNGGKRKDRFIVPLNSTYDLYSMGPDGASVAPLTAAASRDDIIRANDGDFVGPARNY